MAVQTQIQVRRGTASSWTSTNPTLAAGEVGFETDTGKFKIGTGSATWTSLAYFSPGATASPLTTKGDIWGYSTTNVRVPVGSDGQTLVADSSQTTGLGWAGNVAAGKNAVINGGMDIWQRGTSAAGSYPTYLADRWMNYRAVAGSTFSRQNTNDTTNLPNIQYCQRVQRDSGNTATNPIYISQSLESVNSRQFSGQTVVLSWYARAGANFSAASNNMGFELTSGTGTDQNVVAGFTGAVSIVSGSKTLTTTWQRFTATGTVASTATQIGLSFSFTPVGTAGAADYMEITGVQVELGSSATPFSRAGGTIQGELAACQRYFYKITNETQFTSIGLGAMLGTTQMEIVITNPVQMRTNPSIYQVSGTNYFAIQMSAGNQNFNSFTIDRASPNQTSLYVILTATTGGQTGWVYANNAATVLALQAEL